MKFTRIPFVRFRLLIFIVAITLVIIFIFLLGLSWRFISILVHPECKEHEPPINLPPPQVNWLTTKDGHKIQSWFYPPNNNAAIIVLGGINGSLNIPNLPIKSLLDEGFGLILIDSRVCSQPPSPVTLGGNEVFDGEAALEFLLKSDAIDANRIGVWGFSMGGATAIRLAAERQEIQAIIRDGGFSNLGELLSPPSEKRFFIRQIQALNTHFFHFFTGINPWQISPIDDLSMMPPRPIFFIFAETEAAMGMEQYDQAKEPKTLWIVQDSQHGNNYNSSPFLYEEKVILFFQKYLVEDSAK
jgi:pimeloyl-ACP methyl ester carboxylesterase